MSGSCSDRRGEERRGVAVVGQHGRRVDAGHERLRTHRRLDAIEYCRAVVVERIAGDGVTPGAEVTAGIRNRPCFGPATLSVCPLRARSEPCSLPATNVPERTTRAETLALVVSQPVIFGRRPQITCRERWVSVPSWQNDHPPGLPVLGASVQHHMSSRSSVRGEPFVSTLYQRAAGLRSR